MNPRERKTMPEKNAKDWARRLEACARDDPNLALAQRLAANRPLDQTPPAHFKNELRSRLISQYQQPNQLTHQYWRWVLNLGALALLLGILALAMRLTPRPTTNPPAAGNPLATSTGLPAAIPIIIPTPQPTPLGGSGRLVFEHSAQALFGSEANSSGTWRGYQNIFTSNLDGGDPVALIDGPEDVNTLVAFSPDGQKALVFGASNPGYATGPIPDDQSYGNLYVINVDDSHAIRLADHFLLSKPTSASDVSAYWLADSQRIVYIANDNQGAAIFLVNADGSGRVRLTPADARPLVLLRSTDPAFVYWRAGTLEGNNTHTEGFWQTALDGSSTRSVWDTINADYIKISPAGNQIAYQRSSCQGAGDPLTACPMLFVAGIDGTNERPVVWENYPPAGELLANSFYWSPAGDQLLVDVATKTNAGYGQTFYLWRLFDPDAAQLPDALQVWASDSWPVGPPPQWSPDGRMILFENFTWPLPKLLNLDTMHVSEALEKLRPKPGDAGPWWITWAP
jgi:Tol biopolymer transport system component